MAIAQSLTSNLLGDRQENDGGWFQEVRGPAVVRVAGGGQVLQAGLVGDAVRRSAVPVPGG